MYKNCDYLGREKLSYMFYLEEEEISFFLIALKLKMYQEYSKFRLNVFINNFNPSIPNSHCYFYNLYLPHTLIPWITPFGLRNRFIVTYVSYYLCTWTF